MIDSGPEKSSPAEPVDTRKGQGAAPKYRSRLLAGIVLVAYGIYHGLIQYYTAIDHRLLVRSWNGVAALTSYESGQYEKASRYWRHHYGLTYDPASVGVYRKTLADRSEKEPGIMGNYY